MKKTRLVFRPTSGYEAFKVGVVLSVVAASIYFVGVLLGNGTLELLAGAPLWAWVFYMRGWGEAFKVQQEAHARMQAQVITETLPMMLASDGLPPEMRLAMQDTLREAEELLARDD